MNDTGDDREMESRTRPRGDNRVPIELLRLRSATTAYLHILEDSVFSLEVFARTHALPGIEDDPAGILLQRVKRATLDAEVPGTPASIADALAVLLGEAQ